MEKVSEILNNIKDRLSNPLIFSFLLSWLVYNWEITVALVWYDKSQIKACGCNSIFDFISHQLNREGSFRYPVIFAICYTFLVPFIKSIIKLFNTWVTKFTDDKELEILGGGKIGIDKYLELREDYKEKIKNLEDVANEERKYLEENGKLLIEINDVKNNLNNITSEKNSLNQLINRISDFSFLDGQWKYFSENPFDEFFEEKSGLEPSNIFISNGKIFPINIQGIKGENEFFIDEFFYNQQQNKLFFIKKRINDEFDEDYSFEHRNLINILTLTSGNINFLEGKENGRRVKYERVPKS